MSPRPSDHRLVEVMADMSFCCSVNVKELDNELRIDETVHEINEGNKDVELELGSMHTSALTAL